MTVATAATPFSGPGRIARVWTWRQLRRYPNTIPRLGYLGVVVLTTVVLYYLYYVEGAVTPLLLPYYHMSFAYFLSLLVVANLARSAPSSAGCRTRSDVPI